eukprot:Skav233909  [mRNA]  locus=scaffold435:452458:465261:+ [translate_table: standard]
MASKNVGEILEELDSNGDGRLSLEEHLAPYKQPMDPDEDSCRMGNFGARQHELRKEIANAKQRVEERRQEKQLHAEAHLKLLAEMEEKEEASKPLVLEMEKDLSKAKESQEACATQLHVACRICCDDLGVDSGATLGCGHGWYCPGCINRFVEAGNATPHRCIDGLLPKQTIFRLHASNINRAAVASGAKPRPCWWCGAQPYHHGLSCEQHRKKSKARSCDDESSDPADVEGVAAGDKWLVGRELLRDPYARSVESGLELRAATRC